MDSVLICLSSVLAAICQSIAMQSDACGSAAVRLDREMLNATPVGLNPTPVCAIDQSIVESVQICLPKNGDSELRRGNLNELQQAHRGPPEASRERVDARVRHPVVKIPAGDSIIVSASDLCRSKGGSYHRRCYTVCCV